MRLYEIKIEGLLDAGWANWFNELQLSVEEVEGGPPLTILRGPLPDQARLRGILNKIWDLNLNLVSVRQIQDVEAPI